MKKVITYGTYDLLHHGHINLLKRAKDLGDYLIVGVTNDSFDIDRGKLNVRNNVLQRVEAVRSTGYADMIVIEDYLGQKIDDIQKYAVDVFVVGDDWRGKFDYLKEYCEVVYLSRTEGISSTMLRDKEQVVIKTGIVGYGSIANMFLSESKVVNGIDVIGFYDFKNKKQAQERLKRFETLESLLIEVDAVYISTSHLSRYEYIVSCLQACKHVLVESPIVLSESEANDVFTLSEKYGVFLMEANKTAYCPAFNHLMVMIKSGVIGDVVDVEASLSKLCLHKFDPNKSCSSMYELGSYTLLPIVKIMGSNCKRIDLYSKFAGDVDVLTRGIFQYSTAICSFKVGLGVKIENNLIISGTKGYAYVPGTWWKMDYFELRYGDQNENRKFFYKWEGTGLRYEIQEFINCIINNRFYTSRLKKEDSVFMARVMEMFSNKVNLLEI